MAMLMWNVANDLYLYNLRKEIKDLEYQLSAIEKQVQSFDLEMKSVSEIFKPLRNP